MSEKAKEILEGIFKNADKLDDKERAMGEAFIAGMVAQKEAAAAAQTEDSKEAE